VSPNDAFPVDDMLRRRAIRVIPGGMWGHQSAGAVPEGYPQFFAGGDGARVRDVDGNSYIDFMCSWGPVVLGHRHPIVEDAVRSRLDAGDCLDGPTEDAVRLAELMVRQFAHADWAMFQKNGSDATTACVTMARAATRRKKILVARGAYHGAVPWCSPSVVGVTAEDRAHILEFEFNDVDSVDRAVDLAGADLAGIVVSAFRHDLSVKQEMPSAAFARAVRAHCDAADAVLILDDVRAALRLHLGGSWELCGVRPDLCAYSKAIANGHPLAAVTGTDAFRQAADEIFVTGSFWYAGAPMAAACATIEEANRIDVPTVLEAMGTRLRLGLDAQARSYGFELIQSGPPAMPLVQFADDPDCRLGERFCREALRHGVYLHHRHNMFLSAAHDAEIIDEALDATDRAFQALAREGRGNDSASLCRVG